MASLDHNELKEHVMIMMRDSAVADVAMIVAAHIVIMASRGLNRYCDIS